MEDNPQDRRVEFLTALLVEVVRRLAGEENESHVGSTVVNEARWSLGMSPRELGSLRLPLPQSWADRRWS
jgi:hypothetical protein